MVKELLEQRKLPELMKMKDGSAVTRENWEERRLELVDILSEYEYGRMPAYTGKTTAVIERSEGSAAGKAVTQLVKITFPTPDGESFTFPINLTIPKTATAVCIYLVRIPEILSDRRNRGQRRDRCGNGHERCSG